MSKRPIDIFRESAGGMRVGEDDDPITGSLSIDERLFIIKKGSIYEIKLADQIDPERTDPTVPNTQQKFLGYGSNADIVRQTIVTADAIASNFLNAEIDRASILSRSLQALGDLAFMLDMSTELRKLSHAAEAKLHKDSVSVPTIADVEPKAKAFIQKVDHALLSLLGIAKEFFGETVGKGWFESLRNYAEKRFGSDDEFTQFMTEVVPHLQFYRNSRNCAEHPKLGHRLIIKNYAMAPSPLRIEPPTIEVQHPKTPMPAISLFEFCEATVGNIGQVFENALAFMASKTVRNIGVVKIGLVAVPSSEIRDNGARFRFTIVDGPPFVSTTGEDTRPTTASPEAPPKRL